MDNTSEDLKRAKIAMYELMAETGWINNMARRDNDVVFSPTQEGFVAIKLLHEFLVGAQGKEMEGFIINALLTFAKEAPKRQL